MGSKNEVSVNHRVGDMKRQRFTFEKFSDLERKSFRDEVNQIILREIQSWSE